MTILNDRSAVGWVNTAADNVDASDRFEPALAAIDLAVPVHDPTLLSWSMAVATTLLGLGLCVTQAASGGFGGLGGHCTLVVTSEGADDPPLREHCPAGAEPSRADLALVRRATDQLGIRDTLTALYLDTHRAPETIVHTERVPISKRLSGAAVGIVKARRSLTREQALVALGRASRHRDVKLTATAAGMLHTGVVAVDASRKPIPGDELPRPETLSLAERRIRGADRRNDR